MLSWRRRWKPNSTISSFCRSSLHHPATIHHYHYHHHRRCKHCHCWYLLQVRINITTINNQKTFPIIQIMAMLCRYHHRHHFDDENTIQTQFQPNQNPQYSSLLPPLSIPFLQNRRRPPPLLLSQVHQQHHYPIPFGKASNNLFYNTSFHSGYKII